MLLVTALVLCTALFALGYHLGNQLGRTAHVREDIQKARDTRLISRIK